MDKIFKIGLLVLGFSYLAYLFCPVANQVGRYSISGSGVNITILDTANADIYYRSGLSAKHWIKTNPLTSLNKK